MNPLLLLKWWREGAIIALVLFSAGAVHSCSRSEKEVARIKAEDSALAENQRRQNEEKARADKHAYEDSVHAYQDQIAHLRDDTRIASIRVCPRASSPRAVPVTPDTSAGAPQDQPADVPRETTRDPEVDVGPAIDALTRECDDLAVRHAALVNWINSTR